MIDPDDGRPVMLTYHGVPEGNPDSVNSTVYVVGTNVTDTGVIPLTVTDPVYDDG